MYFKICNIIEKLKKNFFSKNFENENNNNDYIISSNNLKSNIQNTEQEKIPSKDIKTELAADINS